MVTWCLILLGWIAADLWWWRVADRRVRNLRMRNLRARIAWRVVLGAFMSVQLSYMIYHVAGALVDGLPRVFPMGWEVAAYMWHLVILPITLLALGAARAGSVVVLLGRWSRPRVRAHSPPTDVGADDAARAPRWTRREALGVVAAAIPPLAAAAVTGRAVAGLGEFRVRRCEISLPALPADLDGLTIAHVTDLHIGRFLPRGMIGRVADATNALAADLVVFTGDLNDLSAPDVRQGIEFMRLLDPRHGLAMVEGNHDVMGDVERFEGPIREAGLPLLLDSASTFGIPGRTTPVQILGIPWGEGRRGSEIGRHGKDARRFFRLYSEEATAASIERVGALRRGGAFPILLAHHPHAFDPAAAAGFPLVLAGHTHGGQIMLNRHLGAGPLRFRYWAGLYQKDASRLFVANGVGNWFPLRINAPAEIVHLTLRTA